MTRISSNAQPLRSAENPLPQNAPMRASVTPPLAVLALTKAGFGPRPGDVAIFDALGSTNSQRLIAWVDQQLNPNTIDDSACDALIAGTNFATVGLTLAQAWGQYVRRRIIDCPSDTSVSNDNGNNNYRPREELERLSLLRAVHTERQLQEAACDFWHNHFHLLSYHSVVRETLMHFHETAIRPYVFGNFRNMLETVIKHPAVQYYTENYTNTDEGENEGLSRKLFDNYTMGYENYLGSNLRPNEVDNDSAGFKVGYIDSDVYETARCFTGWTVDDNDTACDTGTFVYEADEHDDDIKFVLGAFIWANQAELKDGQDVLDMLAQHPATARHICYKLCRRFVSDEPSQALIDSAAAVFQSQWQAADQLKQVMRHILLSAEFSSSWGSKVKRPLEYAASTIRATQCNLIYDYDNGYANDVMSYYNEMGQRLYHWEEHNGYPDDADTWLNSTSLFRRWRFANRLIERTDANSDYFCDVLTTTPATVRSANAMTDFWVERLLGYALDNAERAILVDFMAQGFNPDYDLPITSSTSMHERLRMLVALILMTPSNQWR